MTDARNGGSSGCVEVGAFGKENYNLTGYFNMPKVLELALHNGVDPRTGEQLGPQTGDPAAFRSFDELFAAYETQLRHFIDIKVRGNNVIERLYATYLPAPFLSLLTDDCIATGKDYHDGGPRYNTSYIQGVGLGTLTDCLSALKVHVFEQRTIGMAELLAALDADFAGAERLRQMLLNRTPRYGNDDDYADDLMRRAFEAYYRGGRWPAQHQGRRIPHQPAAHHLPRLLRLGDRRDAGRPPRVAAPVGGRLARAGRRPLRPDRGRPLGGEDGSRPHRRHAAEPEAGPATAARTTPGWTCW